MDAHEKHVVSYEHPRLGFAIKSARAAFADETIHRRNLHLVPVGTAQWRRTLAFRDYLRAHGDVAAEYQALKQRLARAHRLDREAYTEAKSPFINQMTDRAILCPRW
jgi:GrpB-like predicted nucleotidyltransferase (UPF0157 family)